MKERDLFLQALDVADAAERAAFLDRQCAGDAELRRQVDALLAAYAHAGKFLAEPHPAAPGDLNLTGAYTGSNPAPTEHAGQLIAGRYKLLEAIGEGGMGTVWVAEQTQPVRRRVALKLVKAGMDTKSVLVRFEAERQALAWMDHPNIAKVLDGGMTESGRPFFVMEYVKGVPITEYCDAVRLSVAERLRLFVQVCQAVQHAHQKGIIHRDLKPSNILVAPYDDRPVPKIIDFGLAKAMHQSLTERTLYTAHETVLGTPLYMSPEQAQLNNLDVDTRTDVYSLGVLLYELLTGTTPLEKRRLKEAAWDEIRRLIRDEDPPRPSNRLSSTDTLPSLAACRQLEPGKLTKLVRGELDWIVMKSLEKERNRRYESASSLAHDVERYLTGEAVVAAPPSVPYRLRKLVRRHRGPVAAGFAIVTLLIVGVAVTSWLAVRAMDAEQNERDQRLEAQAAQKEADDQLKQAQAARREADRRLYTGHMAFVQLAWDDGRIDRVRELLAGVLPEKTGDLDLRCFEWHYWNRLCERGSLLKIEGGGPLAFSPDGRKLALIGGGAFDDDGNQTKPFELRVCDALTGAVLQSRPFQDSANEFVFSPDGALIAGAFEDTTDEKQEIGYVRIWNAADLSPVKSVKLKEGAARLAFNPSGRSLAALAADKIYLWEFFKGKEPICLDTGAATAKALLFDPSGKRIHALVQRTKEIGGGYRIEDYKIYEFDARTAKRTSEATLPADSEIQEARFSSDGRLVAALTEKGNLQVWETATGKEIRSWSSEGFHHVFNPDGDVLACSSGRGAIELWHVKHGFLLRTYKGHAEAPATLVFSPEGTRLASSDNDEVRIWDVTSPQDARTLPPVSHDYQNTMSVSANGKQVVRTGTDQVTLFETATGRALWRSPRIDRRPLAACLDPSGKRVAALMAESATNEDRPRPTAIHLWDIGRGRQVFQRSLSPSHLFASRLVFSPNGSLLASLTNKADVAAETETPLEIHVWDADTGQELWSRNLPGGSRGQTWSPALLFTPDGKRLTLAGDKVWDARSGEALKPLRDGAAAFGEVAFSPDGHWLATVNDKVVDIVDLRTGQKHATLVGHNAAIRCLAFAPDSRRLATGSLAEGVKLWDPLTAQELLTLKAAIFQLLLSRDGSLLFGEARQDNEIRIWNATPIADFPADTKLSTLEHMAHAYASAKQHARAAELLEEIVALRQKSGSDDLGAVSAKQDWADMLANSRQDGRAEKVYRELTACYEKKFGAEHELALNARRGVASCLRRSQKYEVAEETCREVLAIGIAKLGAKHRETLSAKEALADILERQAKYAQAELLRQELAEHWSNAKRDDETRRARTDLAALYAAWQKYGLAESLFATLQAEIKTRFAKEPNLIYVLANLDDNLAEVYEKQKQFAKAEPLRKEVINLKKAANGEDNVFTLEARANLARLYKAWGKTELAEPILVDVAGRDTENRDHNLQRLVEYYEEIGRKEDAERRRREIMALWKTRAEDNASYAASLAGYGLELLEKRNWLPSESVLRECLAIREKEEPEEWTTFNAKSMLGAAYLGQKKYAEAEPLLLKGYEGLKDRETKIASPSRIRLVEAVERLVRLYEATKKQDQATKWCKELEALKTALTKDPGNP